MSSPARASGRPGPGARRLFVAAAVIALCVAAALVWRLKVPRGLGGVETAIWDPSNEPPEKLKSWERPDGRWHPGAWKRFTSEEEKALTEEQRREFERLRSIGYLAGSTPMPSNSGVIIYDKPRACDGLNFYTSGHFPGALLMDMTGRIVHEWRYEFMDAWRLSPGGERLPRSSKGSGYWRRAHLFENGDVLAIFEGLALIKVDKDSNLLWGRFGGFHHDMDVLDDGRIYVLTREPRIVERINPDHPILEDFITVLDAGGQELRSVSVLEAFEASWHRDVLDGMKESGDVFHTNTIEVLDGTLAGRMRGFEEGNVLICIRELNAIAVVDTEMEQVVWALTAPWVAPHQSTVLPSGHIMIFDNMGNSGGSRVVEFDPVTTELTWIYEGDEPTDFCSSECGSNQRLPNGNTLISESDRGAAFEVMPDGTIVWQYMNPAHAGDEDEYIATLFEVIRLPQDFPTYWAGKP